ncbi:MAG: hypothetical protein C0504_11685 [Candidatus Solibacter sp.]|nr:hypothetical protein [Candidatus Solibacter sp.]
MRVLLASLLLAAALPAPAIEVSTGFLIGPKYDSRAIYVRALPSSPWMKVQAGGYHKSAEGKVLGAANRNGLAGRPPGATMIRVPLQSETENLFSPFGKLDPPKAREISALIASAARNQLIVELGVFHPSRDQDIHAPDFMLDAAGNVVEWLVAGGHRNVIINFAPDWEQAGWDFDHWVPMHLELLAETARARFQSLKAGFASPIAFTLGHRTGENSSLIQAADVVELAGAALDMDTRRIERPVLAVGSDACLITIRRTSGCIVDSPEPPGDPLLRLFFAKLPGPAVGQ